MPESMTDVALVNDIVAVAFAISVIGIVALELWIAVELMALCRWRRRARQHLWLRGRRQ